MDKKIAYFSMEILLESDIPTYSGGLGGLAGDTIRAAADLQVPMVAVTLLHRKGYFFQRINEDGWQQEEPVEWIAGNYLIECGERATVKIEDRQVSIRAWRYEAIGATGFVVPVYLLDTNLPENSEYDRQLTDSLYGGDKYYRLCQEIVLGIGGVRVLNALGHGAIERYHMNEGHASFLGLELLYESAKEHGRTVFSHDDLEAVRQKCIFTTHTPVPAGHDKFPTPMVFKALGCGEEICDLQEHLTCETEYNMTYLALSLSHYVNGVAKKHGEVSKMMFADYQIDAITNGVHAATWAAPAIQKLFDRHIPDWRQDNFNLRYALSIPLNEIHEAHQDSKQKLLHHLKHEANFAFDTQQLMLGFARRSATYKRADLIFRDTERLKAISKTSPFQIVFAGKAHPHDQGGKDIIHHIIETAKSLKNDVKIVYLENYDADLARLMTAGVDVWLNTPIPPMEASGTSGMKAAINGVPSLSVLDGWWLEGNIEGATGWAIGDRTSDPNADLNALHAASLYDKLEKSIIPAYYNNHEEFTVIMRNCIALNGSFFNTHRMLQQYVLKAYF